MQQIVKLLAIIALIWIGTEIYSKGMDDAFGGIFANEEQIQTAQQYVSTPQRVGQRVRDHLREDEERTKQLLDR